MLVVDYLFWEGRVLEGPECQDALLEIGGEQDVVLAVADGDEIIVYCVDVDATDLSSVGVVALELEQVLDAEGIRIFLFLVFLLLLLVFLFLFGSASEGKKTAILILLGFLFLLADSFLDVGRRVRLVEDLLLVELELGQQTLDDSNGIDH